MAIRTRTPWRHQAIELRPIGLRDTILRVAYTGSARRAGQSRSDLERTVRRWAQGIDCTPTQWAELVELVSSRKMKAA